MKDQLQWGIMCAAIIIVILIISFWVTGAFPTVMADPAKTPEFNDTNLSMTKLPSELQYTLSQLESNLHFTVGKWEFDPKDNTGINLYAHDITNETMSDLLGKQIGNYTIHIMRDTEFEATRADVKRQLKEFSEDPVYQIATIGMITDYNCDPPEYYAELWAYNSTPENKNLDNTIINGWKIRVYPMTKSTEMQKKISAQAGANPSEAKTQTE